MGFKCGIIGLPNVGKSTIFNALTESAKAEVANYPFATIEPNIGRVPVPDERLDLLTEIAKSQKTIPTYIDFVDIAGLVKGASSGEGLGNKFLSHIREVDAIAHVVRCFDDENITHVSSKISPIIDIETIETEIKLADLETLENKINQLEKKNKSGDKKIKRYLNIVKDIINKLNNDLSINNNEYTNEELSLINSFNLISSKPMLYICNVDEDSILRGNHYSNNVKEMAEKKNNIALIVSAVIESQIAEFDNKKDKIEMLESLDLKDTTLKKVINAGYELLDLTTFFTCGPKETRAWTIKKNSKVPKAAGKIHTDFEKGFIRAETIAFNDYIKFKGEVACREAGKMRQEGKEYTVKDGDIFNFLFNV